MSIGPRAEADNAAYFNSLPAVTEEASSEVDALIQAQFLSDTENQGVKLKNESFFKRYFTQRGDYATADAVTTTLKNCYQVNQVIKHLENELLVEEKSDLSFLKQEIKYIGEVLQHYDNRSKEVKTLIARVKDPHLKQELEEKSAQEREFIGKLRMKQQKLLSLTHKDFVSFVQRANTVFASLSGAKPEEEIFNAGKILMEMGLVVQSPESQKFGKEIRSIFNQALEKVRTVVKKLKQSEHYVALDDKMRAAFTREKRKELLHSKKDIAAYFKILIDGIFLSHFAKDGANIHDRSRFESLYHIAITTPNLMVELRKDKFLAEMLKTYEKTFLQTPEGKEARLLVGVSTEMNQNLLTVDSLKGEARDRLINSMRKNVEEFKKYQCAKENEDYRDLVVDNMRVNTEIAKIKGCVDQLKQKETSAAIEAQKSFLAMRVAIENCKFKHQKAELIAVFNQSFAVWTQACKEAVGSKPVQKLSDQIMNALTKEQLDALSTKQKEIGQLLKLELSYAMIRTYAFEETYDEVLTSPERLLEKIPERLLDAILANDQDLARLHAEYEKRFPEDMRLLVGKREKMEHNMLKAWASKGEERIRLIDSVAQDLRAIANYQCSDKEAKDYCDLIISNMKVNVASIKIDDCIDQIKQKGASALVEAELSFKAMRRAIDGCRSRSQRAELNQIFKQKFQKLSEAYKKAVENRSMKELGDQIVNASTKQEIKELSKKQTQIQQLLKLEMTYAMIRAFAENGTYDSILSPPERLLSKLDTEMLKGLGKKVLSEDQELSNLHEAYKRLFTGDVYRDYHKYFRLSHEIATLNGVIASNERYPSQFSENNQAQLDQKKLELEEISAKHKNVWQRRMGLVKGFAPNKGNERKRAAALESVAGGPQPRVSPPSQSAPSRGASSEPSGAVAAESVAGGPLPIGELPVEEQSVAMPQSVAAEPQQEFSLPPPPPPLAVEARENTSASSVGELPVEEQPVAVPQSVAAEPQQEFSLPPPPPPLALETRENNSASSSLPVQEIVAESPAPPPLPPTPSEEVAAEFHVLGASGSPRPQRSPRPPRLSVPAESSEIGAPPPQPIPNSDVVLPPPPVQLPEGYVSPPSASFILPPPSIPSEEVKAESSEIKESSEKQILAARRKAMRGFEDDEEEKVAEKPSAIEAPPPPPSPIVTADSSEIKAPPPPPPPPPPKRAESSSSEVSPKPDRSNLFAQITEGKGQSRLRSAKPAGEVKNPVANKPSESGGEAEKAEASQPAGEPKNPLFSIMDQAMGPRSQGIRQTMEIAQREREERDKGIAIERDESEWDV